MPKFMAISGVSLIFSALLVVSAAAQGYVIQTPGQSPTYVRPTPNGGYMMQTPGQPPTYANPTPNGGYVIQTPGQTPTYANPLPGGRAPCIRDFSGNCD